MSHFRISQMRNSSILRLYSEREHIQTDPEYQRMSEVWNMEKRQLLIDTIINDFDIPKLYLHEFSEPRKLGDGRIVKYAIIDGRQRLETIWSFIDGDFTLSDGFVYFADESIKARSMTYSDLSKRYPQLKTQIDSLTLPIMLVMTDDLDLIEEMFLRLNEAVPLNAAEKRNAMGGPMARVIREVSKHAFFRKNIPFSNKRYQHRELSSKLLLLTSKQTIGDTKKAYLDKLVRQYKEGNWVKKAGRLGDSVKVVLTELSKVFTDKDPLLKTQAMSVIYYLVFKSAVEGGWIDRITRDQLVAFDELRAENRRIAEEDITQARYDLLEFDRMHLQGSNDAASIRFRQKVLTEFLHKV